MLTPEKIKQLDEISGLTNYQTKSRIDELRGLTAQVEKPKRTFFEKVADFTGGKELAQGVAQAINLPQASEQLDTMLEQATNQQSELLVKRKELKAQGADTSSIDKALKINSENLAKIGAGAEAMLNPNELTNKQVIGDALQLITTAGGAKLAGAVVGKTGQAVTAGQGLIQGARIGAIGGGAVGAVSGTSQALQEDKEGADIAKSALGGALIGAGAGGILGGITGGISGFLQGKKLTNQTLSNHLDTAKMELEQMTPEQINKLGGVDKLLEQNKQDIVMQLKSQGLTDKANRISKLKIDDVADFDTYSNAVKEAITGKNVPKTNFALDLVSPKATTAVKEQALKEGRVTEQGLLKASKILPSRRDKQLAEAVQGVVNPKKSAPENLNLIESKVNDINTGVKAFVKAKKVPFNTSQLNSQLEKGKSDLDLIFASDKNAEKTYNAVTKKFIELVKNKDTAGLLDARQEFDSIPAVKKLLESDKLGENARKEIVMTIRTQANKYIASLLPKGNQYRETLLKESRMIEAMQNIAEKNVGLIGTNKLQILTEKYPILKWIAGGIVGGASVGVGGSIINSTD